ncbi:protein of unassigned function [Methylobacterium oryzae CBMB20]|uniref:Protein of unassigned function n=1 Tax=Methylobacterium oryzae CBMB20 TaxID=693986 RepID=A0A089NVP1_9HYPH|nr:protein of unassigned function [Methylobacterium oryzae CBMB20]
MLNCVGPGRSGAEIAGDVAGMVPTVPSQDFNGAAGGS